MAEIIKLELLINLINATDNLNGPEFNKNQHALDVYSTIYGKEKLQETLASKDDLHLNKFYYPDWVLRYIVENNHINLREVKKLSDKIENEYTKNWFKIFLIQKAIDSNELDLSEVIIAELPDLEIGPVRYLGHRIMLQHYAKSCNLEGFIKRLKLSKPAKFPKNEIINTKYLMIENISKEYGFEKGLELCNEKVFGHQFSIASLRWTAHLFELNKIDSILEMYDVITISEPNAKADLYVKHFYNQRPVSINESEFLRVLSEIIKVDKNKKYGDIRLRDSLLMDLGVSTLNQAQVKDCRKEIISPIVKKELTYHLEDIKNGKL